jgi:hypothetical protein
MISQSVWRLEASRTSIFSRFARAVGAAARWEGMVWGYLKSELQALPLEPDHNYSIGRKLDSDLVLKVRRSRSCL